MFQYCSVRDWIKIMECFLDAGMNTETLMKILITLDGMDEDELIARLLGDEQVGTADRDLAYEYQMDRVIEVDND